jgi:hypothetical protein
LLFGVGFWRCGSCCRVLVAGFGLVVLGFVVLAFWWFGFSGVGCVRCGGLIFGGLGGVVGWRSGAADFGWGSEQCNC